MTYRIKRRYFLCGFYARTEIEQFKTSRLIVVFHLAVWVSTEHMLCVLFVLADVLRERPLWSACLLAVTMKYCWGHTRVWELLIQKSAYVTHSCGPCREQDGWKLPHWSGTVKRPHPRSIFSPMCLPPSHPLIFQDGNELGGGGNPPLSLPCSRCLCNLHTGLQSATEPLFIRLILKSTFCRPRKRLAKL